MKELPPDAADWKSDLNNKVITQADVDKARQDFQSRNFDTCNDFLIWYMRLDCILLFKSTIKMSEAFLDMLGVHMLDSNCKSLSSLSFLSTQLELARTARPNMSKILDRKRYSVNINYFYIFFILICFFFMDVCVCVL